MRITSRVASPWGCHGLSASSQSRSRRSWDGEFPLAGAGLPSSDSLRAAHDLAGDSPSRASREQHEGFGSLAAPPDSGAPRPSQQVHPQLRSAVQPQPGPAEGRNPVPNRQANRRLRTRIPVPWPAG